MVRTKQKSWTTPRPINGIKVSFKNMHCLYFIWQIYWVNKCKQAVCFVLKIKISCFSTMLFSLNITCTCISFNLIYLTIHFFSVPAILPYSAWYGNNLLPNPTGNGVYLISRRWPPFGSTESENVHELVCDKNSCNWNKLPQGTLFYRSGGFCADYAPTYLLLPLDKWGSKWGDFHWAMGCV